MKMMTLMMVMVILMMKIIMVIPMDGTTAAIR